MIGGDFEAVYGQWGLRGEVAAFNGRDSVESGIGVDRKAGSYRVSGTAMFTHQPARNDFTVVSSVDRSFARETRSIRAFAVYNPREESAFARVIAAASLRDNLSIEGSAGWFGGSPEAPSQGASTDLLARFSDRDFIYARLKVFF
jgi:hypothetical protein